MADSTVKDIKVRRVERRDTQGVIDLILPIQREEFGIAITADDQPDLAAIDAFYQVGLGDVRLRIAPWARVRGRRPPP
jgi:hypothetical protein